VTVPEAAVTTGSSSGATYTLVEMTRPTLDIPAGIPTQTVWNALVSLPFLPSNLRTALKSEQNWRDTLIVPLPGHPQNVTFMGRPAILEVGPHGHDAFVAWLQGNALVGFAESSSGALTPSGFLAQSVSLLTP
jgi:hypothetical protein